MKRSVSIIFFLLALVAAAFTLLGDDSYRKLVALRQSLAAQKETNTALDQKVRGLKGRISGVLEDDRALEREARNQLGLARPNELIFFFEKNSNGQRGLSKEEQR